jgi:pimeloyl-ACP methyl ester carboxylesterase
MRASLVVSLVAITLLLVPSISSAQIIIIPDCNLFPEDPFCQGQCTFDPTLPWCTPPEPERDPIVLVPPLISSYNKKLMKTDEPGGNFKFVFLGNTFKALIKKLEMVGYEMGKDLFVAHYDWRQSNETSAQQYLQPVIQQAKSETSASKVDLVAHSMGGLVARSYIQGDIYDSDVDQLITLGTPHAGASGAYQAWEGGQYPETWNPLIRHHVNQIEGALKKTRNMKDATRPSTFRSFFPSLRDLLPIDQVVTRDGNDVTATDLTEQNPLLQGLRSTFNLIADRGIAVATIGAKDQDTLAEVSLIEGRTDEDNQRNRWRDGHANPDPPTANSTDGDRTVLISSAHVGTNNTTLTDSTHLKLPTKAQDEVLELLGLEEVEEEFVYEPPKKIFGITILSPLDATVEGPNGEMLSKNQNDFGDENAEYDDDPSDPDDPIDITIVDPPDGEYEVTYTGTGEGEYTIITSYADEDETVTTTKDGTTEQGKVETEMVMINDETTSLIDDADYKELLREISRMARQAKKDKLLKGYERANLTRPVRHALSSLRIYERRLEKGREGAALKRLRSYYEKLDDIEEAVNKIARRDGRDELVEDVLQLLEKIRLHSPPL